MSGLRRIGILEGTGQQATASIMRRLSDAVGA